MSRIDPSLRDKLTSNGDAGSQKLVLVAHAVATMGDSPIVTDRDMDYPKNWRNAQSNGVGHREHGRTICLHSLAVLPQFQGIGLGPLLMRAYLRYTDQAGLADRTALLCEEVCCVRLLSLTADMLHRS